MAAELVKRGWASCPSIARYISYMKQPDATALHYMCTSIACFDAIPSGSTQLTLVADNAGIRRVAMFSENTKWGPATELPVGYCLGTVNDGHTQRKLVFTNAWYRALRHHAKSMDMFEVAEGTEIVYVTPDIPVDAFSETCVFFTMDPADQHLYTKNMMFRPEVLVVLLRTLFALLPEDHDIDMTQDPKVDPDLGIVLHWWYQLARVFLHVHDKRHVAYACVYLDTLVSLYDGIIPSWMCVYLGINRLRSSKIIKLVAANKCSLSTANHLESDYITCKSCRPIMDRMLSIYNSFVVPVLQFFPESRTESDRRRGISLRAQFKDNSNSVIAQFVTQDDVKTKDDVAIIIDHIHKRGRLHDAYQEGTFTFYAMWLLDAHLDTSFSIRFAVSSIIGLPPSSYRRSFERWPWLQGRLDQKTADCVAIRIGEPLRGSPDDLDWRAIGSIHEAHADLMKAAMCTIMRDDGTNIGLAERFTRWPNHIGVKYGRGYPHTLLIMTYQFGTQDMLNPFVTENKGIDWLLVALVCTPERAKELADMYPRAANRPSSFWKNTKGVTGDVDTTTTNIALWTPPWVKLDQASLMRFFWYIRRLLLWAKIPRAWSTGTRVCGMFRIAEPIRQFFKERVAWTLEDAETIKAMTPRNRRLKLNTWMAHMIACDREKATELLSVEVNEKGHRAWKTIFATTAAHRKIIGDLVMGYSTR